MTPTCRYGHEVPERTKDGNCVTCARLMARAYAADAVTAAQLLGMTHRDFRTTFGQSRKVVWLILDSAPTFRRIPVPDRVAAAVTLVTAAGLPMKAQPTDAGVTT